MSSEKDQNGNALVHVATEETRSSTPDEKHVLEQQHTLSAIDVENSAAFKGDDSDGLVEWNFRNILASIFLCMLYTGMRSPHA